MLLDMLLAGELDAFIGRLPTASVSTTIPAVVRYQKLYEEPMCIACSVNHRLAKARKITVDDLGASQWVLPSRESTVAKGP